MVATVYSSDPAVPVQVVCGRSITRVQDFKGRDGDRIHIERRAIQGTFTDASGTLTNCVLSPVQGWSLDMVQFERKTICFHVVTFSTDKSGSCVFQFCGFEEAKK